MKPNLVQARIRLERAHPSSANYPLKDSRIIIHKSQKIAKLYDGDTLIKEYPIAFGENPVGAKNRVGDGKTHEGNYHICTRVTPSQYHLFLGINYPNPDFLFEVSRLAR
jgi:murein L,D-transpeptidase YafK